MDLNYARLERIRETRPLRYVEQTTSTNTLALAWIRDGALDGSLVLADEQTEGRGRLGRLWFAPAGSALLLTYIFYTNPSFATQAAMLGSLAVAETCDALGIKNVGIKYPNDVQIDHMKTCGILAEALWTRDQVGIALGIGLNIRVNFRGTSLETSATSLEHFTRSPLDRADVLEILLSRLDFWRPRIGYDDLFNTWRTRLNMLGKTVEVSTGTAVVRGTAQDVDQGGALVITDSRHIKQRVVAGDLLVYR